VLNADVPNSYITL